MAIVVIGKLTLAYATDGAGPMFEPDAQAMTFPVTLTVVAGGNAPTTTQITNAVAAAAATAAAQFNAAPYYGTVLAWNQGNP